MISLNPMGGRNRTQKQNTKSRNLGLEIMDPGLADSAIGTQQGRMGVLVESRLAPDA